jgi:hypothetical protein
MATSTRTSSTRPAPARWDEATFVDYFGKIDTPEQLVAKEQELNSYGIRVSRNARGHAGKIMVPTGDGGLQWVDMIKGAGAQAEGVGQSSFLWQPGPTEYDSARWAPLADGSNPAAPGQRGAVPNVLGGSDVQQLHTATPPHGNNPRNAPATGTAIARTMAPYAQAATAYAAAYAVSARARGQARTAGRASTILGGFGSGSPTVGTPTILGR